MTMTTLQVTEVVIHIPPKRDGKLLAIAHITLSGVLAIRGIKLIRRPGDGKILLFMPDRKKHTHCDACGGTIPLVCHYCQCCGTRQPFRTGERLHAELVFPTCSEQRRAIEEVVFRAYDEASSQDAEVTTYGRIGQA